MIHICRKSIQTHMGIKKHNEEEHVIRRKQRGDRCNDNIPLFKPRDLCVHVHKCVVSVRSQCVVTGWSCMLFLKCLHLYFWSFVLPLNYTHSFVSVYFAFETVSFTGLQFAKQVILTGLQTGGTHDSTFSVLRLQACTSMPGLFFFSLFLSPCVLGIKCIPWCFQGR